MLKKNFQNFIATYGGAAAFLHNGQKTTKNIDVEFSFGENSYRFSMTPTAEESFLLSFRRYKDLVGVRFVWWERKVVLPMQKMMSSFAMGEILA